MKPITFLSLLARVSGAIVIMALAAEPSSSETAPTTAPVQITSIPAVGTSSTDSLIVYRAHAEPTAFTPAIEIDGSKIVSLPNRHYTSINISPGVHTLTIAWPRLSRQRAAEMSVDIKASERHYFEVMGTSRATPLGGG